MHNEPKLRIVGLCILAAFLLFGGGMTLLDQGYINLGLTLALLNSFAVVTVGFILAPIMTATGSAYGGTYRTARIVEGAFLAISIFVAQSGYEFLGLSTDSSEPKRCVP